MWRIGGRLNRPDEHREIVQIGAARLDGRRDFREEAAFEIFVLPRISPVLSSLSIELTGIRQEQVDRHGHDPDEAFAQFAAFPGDGPAPVLAFGGDSEILGCSRRWRPHRLSIQVSSLLTVHKRALPRMRR